MPSPSSVSSQKKREDALRRREEGFSLSGVHHERLPDYNALVDRNLRHHFESRTLQSHLGDIGLIDQRGRVVDLAKNKAKLSIIEQEFRSAEQSERRRSLDEDEIRRRVQLKRHDALHDARQKDKLLQLREEKKIVREIVQAAKGYASVSKPSR
ncbi:hypothetical protein PybrP1_002846 [[Pythium] brassicae (nom. inval.)]|nr:hypothetical protein PybrP1_002846 [[Pythium] brassicae (nom. inval.)]